MRLIPLTCCLILAGLGLFPATATAAAAPDADDEVGYSTDARGARPVTEKKPATVPSVPQDPTPEITITIDAFKRLPPESEVKGQSEKREPIEPAPSRSGSGDAASGPSPAGKTTSNAPPAPYEPSPRVSPGASRASSGERPSPVLDMIRGTLRSRFSETQAIKRNMPKKIFAQNFDKASANKWSRLGNDLLNKQNNPPEALKAYETAYAHDRSSSEINGSYGYALFRNGQFPQARDKVIESLEISPGYAAAWFVLGQIYGWLKEEDNAYACMVNTCLFTKNMTTSLGFLERERERSEEPVVQAAAARALETCRGLTANDLSGTPSSNAVPSSPRPEQAVLAARSTPTPAGYRFGKINLRTLVFESAKFPEVVARIGRIQDKAERDRRLESMLIPIFGDIRETTRRHAKANGYQVVISSDEEGKFRGNGRLSAADLSMLDMDPAVLEFLNSGPGKDVRKSAPIDDLTGAVGKLMKRP